MIVPIFLTVGQESLPIFPSIILDAQRHLFSPKLLDMAQFESSSNKEHYMQRLHAHVHVFACYMYIDSRYMHVVCTDML